MAHHIPAPHCFAQHRGIGWPMFPIRSMPDVHRLWMFQKAHFSNAYPTVAVDTRPETFRASV